MRLACQEHLLPGDGIVEKWVFASSAGFDGIELRGTEDWRHRRDDLIAARERGCTRGRLAQVGIEGRQGDPEALRRRLVLTPRPP